MPAPDPKPSQFKASIALSLLGEEINTARLQRLSGSKLPKGRTRMLYTPSDMLNIRARLAGLDPEDVRKSMLKNKKWPRIIVTRMTKGGIGKTSVTVNMACALAMMGFRVLLIDADPQASATNMLGIPTEQPQQHIGFLLTEGGNDPAHPDDLSKFIIPIIEGGFLDLIPSDIDLDSSNALLTATMGREQRAEDFLKRNQAFLSKNYDVILVDTTPGTTPVSNAFAYLASHSGKVLTVLEPEGSSLRALDALAVNLSDVARVARKPIDVAILVNKSQLGRKQSELNYAILQQNYSTKILPTQITYSIAFSRQVDADNVENSMPVVLREPSSKTADNLFSVARILINEFDVLQPGFENAKA